VASENGHQARSDTSEPASENTKRRVGRAPVPIDGRYAAVLDEYLATLDAAPLAARARSRT
jgi:hypothetical protein